MQLCTERDSRAVAPGRLEYSMNYRYTHTHTHVPNDFFVNFSVSVPSILRLLGKLETVLPSLICVCHALHTTITKIRSQIYK